jgi:hypothetical protein
VKRSRFTKIVADLSLEPFTFHGADVVELLERVRNQFGYSKAMRVDPGTAFVPRSRPVDLSPGVTLDFSQPSNAT